MSSKKVLILEDQFQDLVLVLSAMSLSPHFQSSSLSSSWNCTELDQKLWDCLQSV